jgi:hypothetical protein
MYDEKTLRKVLQLLTSESGRTESYEATVRWIENQLADLDDHQPTWEVYR